MSWNSNRFFTEGCDFLNHINTSIPTIPAGTKQAATRPNPMGDLQKLDAFLNVKDMKRKEFAMKFEKIKSDDVKEKLEDLYDKINVQSDKLKENMYLKDFVEYKKLVRNFLDVAVKNSHEFSNENFLDKRGRHRTYSVVKKVDRELDSITREFLKSEVDHMSVLKKMDSIRGMLVDTFM